MRRWLPVAAAVVAVVLVACGSAEPVRATITVEGMHCDGCSTAISDELGRIDGVVEASADWRTGRAEAAFDPSTVTRDRLRAAVESLGYDVVAVEIGTPADG